VLEGTLLAFVLILVSRPVATVIATLFGQFKLREQVVLGWAGLRGAVPVVLATFPVIAGVPESLEFFNIVFFAVLVSTVLQGTTFEPLAKRLGVTTAEPALPRPLTEMGTIRRLGAEVVEYPIQTDDAIVGVRVRDLALPRDALVTVVVREGSALLPRGSTRLESGDRLHLLVREEAARAVRDLLEGRWRTGPIGRPSAPRRPLLGRSPIFTVRPWAAEDGDPADPEHVLGAQVMDHLRTRRDSPGALLALDDGRYAATGSTVAVGGAGQLQEHARRRARNAKTEAERTWWEDVVGALTR